MNSLRTAGFTLIELLTVIAIIAILAGFVMVGVPKALERAKIADVENDLRTLQTALASYYAENDSYPPAYGYLKFGSKAGDPAKHRYWLEPYVVAIDHFRDFDLYDRFSPVTHDTNADGVLQRLEYSPVGHRPSGEAVVYRFIDELYDPDVAPSADMQSEIDRQLMEERPYLYVPVNLRQFETVRKYYYKKYDETGDADYMFARIWDVTDPRLATLKFPPPRYDAFVLISLGPKENSFGVIPSLDDMTTPPPVTTQEEIDNLYHILSLQAYFLATRDYNDNGRLDFDYRARRQEGEGKDTNWPAGQEKLHFLPDRTNDVGPIILEAS